MRVNVNEGLTGKAAERAADRNTRELVTGTQYMCR